MILIKRIFYNLAYELLRIHWFFIRPKTKGVKCLLLSKPEILEAKWFSYGNFPKHMSLHAKKMIDEFI